MRILYINNHGGGYSINVLFNVAAADQPRKAFNNRTSFIHNRSSMWPRLISRGKRWATTPWKRSTRVFNVAAADQPRKGR
jgi:hypothetical protein